MQIVSKINIWLKPFVSDPFVCPDAIGYFLSFWSSWGSIYLIDTVTAKSFKTLRNEVIENLTKNAFWRFALNLSNSEEKNSQLLKIKILIQIWANNKGAL